MTGPAYETRGQWMQALVLALLAHGAGAAVFLDLPSRPAERLPPAPPQVEVTGLALETASLRPADPVQPEIVPPQAAGPQSAVPSAVLPDPVQPVVIAPVAPGTVAPSAPQIGPGDTDTPSLAEAAPGIPTGTPQSQAMIALIAAIRARLAEPCLIAVPQAAEDGAVELTVIGADDQNIAGFMSAIAGEAEGVGLLERSVLLDQRQCPALAYARAASSYPVAPLVVSLEQGVVASGGSLRGMVRGVDAAEAALLLVDDNGVVQDLDRFSAVQGDTIGFDVPVRRSGLARDTSQIVMALTGPGMAALIAQYDGQQADQVFAALGPAPAPGVQVSVTAFHLR